MNITVITPTLGFEEIAKFEHVKQAVACLPALARASGYTVFMFSDEPLNLTTGELPKSCRFTHLPTTSSDGRGRGGIICNPPAY